MDVSGQLLERIKSRTSRQAAFGHGIRTADVYVRTVAECVGSDVCERHFGNLGDTGQLLKSAAKKLTHSNDDMVVEEKAAKLPDGIELPKNTLMVFKHVLTTPRKDRDNDRLRTEGAEVDPKMLLLWQHIHTLPIGKLLGTAEHNSKRLSLYSAVVDVNELAHDSAVMIDNGMGRFSHGFRVFEFDELKEGKEGETEPTGEPGFDVKRFEIMEESLVSVPSNVDAETEDVLLNLIDGGKLTSGFFKAMGKKLHAGRPVAVAGGLDVTTGGIILKDRVGDYERTLEVGSFQDLQAAADMGLVTTLEGKQNGQADEAGEHKCECSPGGQASAGSSAEAGKTGGEEIQVASNGPGDAEGLMATREKLPEDSQERPRAIHTDKATRITQSGTKALDVEREYLEAAKLEYDWVSRYLDCTVKELYVCGTYVTQMKVPSFLYGLATKTGEWDLHDTRNLTHKGTEEPPIHEMMQLNAEKAEAFLVEGMQFWKATDEDGREWKVVIKQVPAWGGQEVVIYAKASDAGRADKVASDTWHWLAENNFLKGEAFSLSGQFLKRGETGWNDVFLTPKQKEPLEKLERLVNEKGDKLANRGLIFMGPPGTGKTLSSRVLLNNVKATYIWCSAKDLIHRYAPGAIEQAFELAKELAPSVLCFEDIDTWLSATSIDVMKTEMDGLEVSSGMTTILTTNFPERLPEALIDRPGRFHDVVEFGVPDLAVRKAMLDRWLDGASEDEVNDAAKETDGMSGAHLYELAYFARTLQEEDENLKTGDAVKAALDKVSEQRELVGGERESGLPFEKMAGHREARAEGITEPLSAAAVEPEDQKSGKKLSAKNVKRLEDMKGDMEEIGADKGLSRGSKALCKGCGFTIEKMIEESSGSSGDEAEEKPDKHSECGAGWTLDDAQALLLAEGDELRLRAVKRAVDAILEVTRQDQMADEFRQLAE